MQVIAQLFSVVEKHNTRNTVGPVLWVRPTEPTSMASLAPTAPRSKSAPMTLSRGGKYQQLVRSRLHANCGIGLSSLCELYCFILHNGISLRTLVK